MCLGGPGLATVNKIKYLNFIGRNNEYRFWGTQFWTAVSREY